MSYWEQKKKREKKREKEKGQYLHFWCKLVFVFYFSYFETPLKWIYSNIYLYSQKKNKINVIYCFVFDKAIIIIKKKKKESNKWLENKKKKNEKQKLLLEL